MSIDLTKQRLQYRILVRLYHTLPGGYWPITEMGTGAARVGNDVYDPILLSIGEINEAFPKEFQSRFPLPTLTLEIADTDGTYQQYLEDYNFCAYRQVEIFIWEPGTTFDADSNKIFQGYIEWPGGVEIDNARQTISLRVSDYRTRWSNKIPSETMEKDGLDDLLDLPEEYDLPEENEGKYIPLLYGDFTSELSSSGNGAEAFVVDTGQRELTDVDPILLVAKPAERLLYIGEKVHIIRQAALDQSDKYTSADAVNLSLTNGTFQLDADTWSGSGGQYSYQEGDRFFIEAMGEAYQSCSDHLLMTNPAQILRHLILENTSAGSEHIHASSYTTVFQYFNRGSKAIYFVARAQLIQAEDVWKTIEQFCFEWGIELSNRGGKVHFALWQPFLISEQSGTPDLCESDIVPGSFRTIISPNDLYANKIQCEYSYDPALEKYLRKVTKQYPGMVVETATLELKFRWHYYRKSVRWRTYRLAWLFSKAIRIYEFTCGFKALNWSLGQRKVLTYRPAGLTARDVHLRRLHKDLSNGTVQVQAWDAYLRNDIGRWAPADAKTYDQANIEDHHKWGYWTNQSGEAHEGDSESKLSHWL